MSVVAKSSIDERVPALLEGLSAHLSGRAIARIPRLLDPMPDPVGALQRLLQFCEQTTPDTRPEDFDGKAVYAALTVFSNSRYLSNLLLSQPELLRWALEPENLERPTIAGELRSEIGSFYADAADEVVAVQLARLKRQHMLRIAMRDLLGFAPLAETARDLSSLADALIQAAHDHIRQQLVRRFGRPLCDARNGQIICGFAVIALGKLGGAELNYSSDVDLMYIHTGDGNTHGPVVTTNQDFTVKLAKRLTNMLSVVTPEGFSYRIDLRLRPEGNAGELVYPISAATQYYFQRARDWELQMLLKARPVAGDLRLGRMFLDVVTPRIYRTTTDFSQIESLAATRDRIQKARRSRPATALDVKLDPGGIRDIEFLVQCLQRLHGGQDTFLRSGGTMYALHRLREKGYLADHDYSRLFRAYSFLRTVEHRLQLANNQQTHQLPTNEEAACRVAIQMGKGRSPEAPESLRSDIEDCCRSVSEIYDRVIRGQREPSVKPAAKVQPSGRNQTASSDRAAPVASSVWRVHLPRLRQFSPPLAESFDSVNLQWGNRMLEQLLERIVGMPSVLQVLSGNPDVVPRIAQLVDYSSHFGGYLLRFPEDLAVIAGDVGATAEPMPRSLEHIMAVDQDPDDTAGALRRLYRRQMLSIQTRSVCDGDDVFATLSDSSDLAEGIMRAAHALATREAAAQKREDIDPTRTIRVIALGRLGMREFDFGSDADVAFVIPNSEAPRIQLWTLVANRIIDIVSSYTADGQMFTIDARLRPLGRNGDLVQTEAQFLAYFSGTAESWEAITYMKARNIAGDAEAGREFLAKLQDVLWQRFSHEDEFAALLLRMRMRLEAEQGAAKPLKSGPGGYYDIDFILLYWRLRHAEAFYESLNTPQRIEIIRKTDPAFGPDLDKLLRATQVLRSLDHGVRVSTGTSAHDLPPTEWQRQLLGALVSRWLPNEVRQGSLTEIVDATRTQVREVFGKAFEGVG